VAYFAADSWRYDNVSGRGARDVQGARAAVGRHDCAGRADRRHAQIRAGA